MPEFFIPAAKDAAEAESVLENVAKFINRSVPTRRIFRITYIHNGKAMTAEVGKDPDPYYREKGPVIAIFGGDPHCVCLPDRGVVRGGPILVGQQSVQSTEYFDAETMH